jgi:hypothetical protein
MGDLPLGPLLQLCFVLGIFKIGPLELFAWGWCQTNPPDLCLLSIEDYMCEQPALGSGCSVRIKLTGDGGEISSR